MFVVTQGYLGPSLVTQGYASGAPVVTAGTGGGGPPRRARVPLEKVPLHETLRKGLNDVLAEEAAKRRRDVDVAAALLLLED